MEMKFFWVKENEFFIVEPPALHHWYLITEQLATLWHVGKIKLTAPNEFRGRVSTTIKLPTVTEYRKRK